jgi:hypothetical protein
MLNAHIRGLFEKFVDSTYYSDSELCGGAVTVSFSKNLPWQAMHFLQRSTHFSKTCCRPFAASFRRIVVQAVLASWSLRNFEISSKALPALESLSSPYWIVSIGLMDESYGFWSTFSKPNTEFNRETLTLRHPKKGSFKTTVTLALTPPLLRYPHHYN